MVALALAAPVTAAPERPVFGTGMALVGMVPREVTIGEPPAGIDAAGGTELAPATAVVDEPVATEEEPAGGGAVPLAEFIAFFKYASKDLSAVGLMAKTIPAWQWFLGFVCAQKNQSGAVALSMVIFHWAKVVVVLAVAWKPESTPVLGVVIKEHGLANVDCVTE